MKYVDEFRDRARATVLVREIEKLVATIAPTRRRPIQIMEVCGGHTHSIFRYGIEGLLPDALELVHGPGCPVWVLPMGRVDDCVAIAEQPRVIFTTFGDAMRVPGSRKSLSQAKAEGADVRMVYSPMDALELACRNPDREVVFFAIGFETTMPATALTVLQAANEGIGNFSVFCNHITIVPTIKAILDSPDLQLDGFLGPGHVSMVVGTAPLRVHRPILPQASGRRRLRADRCAALARDGSEADQGRARRGREPVCAHRSGRRQRSGARGGGAGLRAA
jgi:hydrogenase expression/formation protein HypD